MPQYVYIDAAEHTVTVTHPMSYSTGVICACGLVMHRKPQAFYVSWGGLRPSQGELSPAVKRMVDSAAARRGEYEKR